MRKFIVAALVAAALMAFPPKIIAAHEYKYYKVYTLSQNDRSFDLFDEEVFGFMGNFTDEQIALVLFSNLIEPVKPRANALIPGSARLLGLKISNGTLTLNLSCGILLYGGTAREQGIIAEIAKTAAEINGVSRLTLRVEGFDVCLTEGSHVYELELNQVIPLPN